MNENTKKLYEQVYSKNNSSANVSKVLLIITLASLILAIAGSMISQGVMMFGMTICIFSFMAWVIYVVATGTAVGSLKKSFKTLEKTGSLQYINEILNKEYNSNGKIAFSKHYLYIPGKLIVAYEDIVNIYPYKLDHYIVTIDGKKHYIRVKKDIIKELLNHQTHIPYNESYKNYKHKIANFKATGRK